MKNPFISLYNRFVHSRRTPPAIIPYDKSLRNRNRQNTKKFSFDGQTHQANIVKVYDGDTVTAVFHFHDDYYQFSIRLLGIDTPEIRTKSPSEKILGLQARNFLRSLVLEKIVTLECHKFGKYGRILGTIWIDGKNINQTMIECGFAKKYNP